MGAGHSHDALPRASERTTTILAVIIGVIVFITAMGAAAVWPEDYSYRGSLESAADNATWVSVTVKDLDDQGMPLVDIAGDGSDALVAMTTINDPTIVIEKGDKARALQLTTGEVIFSDFERGTPLLWLFIAYAVLVVAIAWWRGLGALLGLVLAGGVVVFFTIPALFNGGSPLIIGLVTGAGALFFLLYLAHGPNARTTTAYLGTLAGLVVTALIALWAVDSSKLHGLWSDDFIHLEFYDRGVSLKGILLCGIILAGLGVLNDVTVTQASALWELKAARPDLGWWQLYSRAMRIGRDHIASTVYTIAFAYVGAALPTLMFVALYGTSLGTTLTSADIAEEVVRTLVGSIGLVLAVPLTTLIGAVVVAGDTGPRTKRVPRGGAHGTGPAPHTHPGEGLDTSL